MLNLNLPDPGVMGSPSTAVGAATYTMTSADIVLHVTYTATGTVAITLPTAQCINRRVVTIKDAGGNAGTYNITLSTEGTEKIDGADTLVINGDYNSATIYAYGGHWWVI